MPSRVRLSRQGKGQHASQPAPQRAGHGPFKVRSQSPVRALFHSSERTVRFLLPGVLVVNHILCPRQLLLFDRQTQRPDVRTVRRASLRRLRSRHPSLSHVPASWSL